MKKLWLLLPLLILLFSFRSAAYTGPTGNTYQYEYVFTEGGSTLRFYSNYLFFGCSQETNNGRPYLCAYIPYSSSVSDDISKYYVTDVTTGRNTYYMDVPYRRYPTNAISGIDTQWINWAELKYNNGQSTANWRVNWTTAIFQAANVPVFSTYEAAAQWANEELQPDIEWDNPYYSANIPAPVFEVYNAELNSVPVVDVPLSFDFQYVPSNAYVEIWADYSIPTKLNVLPFPPNTAQYRVMDYNVASVNVLDKELLYQTEALNSNYVHVILRDGWDDVLENFPIENIEFTTQVATSGWLDNKIADYEDLRKTNTLYGSAIKIKMRYFTIVDQTQFVVGPWRIWDSKNPGTFTNELPSTYQVYLPANGTTGTNTDVSPNVEIPVGSGTPTGTYYDPNVNITVTQNVPNYPDYPTIVSYNKDNLLVDTMNWADNLQGFFGEFGSFLEVSFAFIPGWIWAIIGFGFSLSIVVMFLKIL